MTDCLNERFAAARRQYIASQFSQLNDMQLQAVLTTEGPLLLLAGAGSGKTTVLIQKIANLIRFGCGSDSTEVPWSVTEADLDFLEHLPASLSEEEKTRADSLCALRKVAPWSIIAITFTNKAANEMKARLAMAVGPDAQDVWAMTFHSACCRILRKYIDLLGYDRSFTIYDTSDAERLMKGIIKDMALDEKTFSAKSVLYYISRAKDRMQSPEDLAEQAEKTKDYRQERIADLYGRYQKSLKSNNAVDFDDLLCLAVQLMEKFPEVREYYQNKFRYVLIDEYQDTNYIQYRLAHLLAEKSNNICVVGDDDQSIYRFRGATIENILNFEDGYPGAKTIRLEQNYRSTQSILNAANAVIENNQGRKGKTLWTQNDPGEKILVYEADNESGEANFVASQILSQSRKGSFQDFAVLYRTNAQSNALEYAFKRNGIPYRMVGGIRFFSRAEVKDMLSYLCIINNRSDDFQLKRIVNQPPRGLGGKTIETVERMAQSQGLHMYEVLSHPEDYASLQRSAPKLKAFTDIIEDCAKLLRNGMPLDEFYDELLVRSGYLAMLAGKRTEESETRRENVQELKSSILSYMENTENPTLSGFLEEIALYTDLENYDPDAEAVVLMTMHSAKGLEFPQVFMVGMEEGIFPGMRAIGEPDEIEEERRLCYVGMTRAKKQLYMSYARQRMLYGRTNAYVQSRFIKEIPESLVEHRGGYKPPEKSRADNPYGGNAVLARKKRIHAVAESSDFAKQISSSANVEYHTGDQVQHTAFGKGMITSVLKTGGDALLEIAFDEIGTKRLMAKAASVHMKKL